MVLFWTFLYCLHKNLAKINLYSDTYIKLIKNEKKRWREREREKVELALSTLSIDIKVHFIHNISHKSVPVMFVCRRIGIYKSL